MDVRMEDGSKDGGKRWEQGVATLWLYRECHRTGSVDRVDQES